MNVWSSLKKAYRWVFSRLPLRKLILLESYPCYTDSTKEVYEEMLRRGWHREYRMVWVHADYESPSVQIPHAEFASDGPGLWKKLRFRYLVFSARALISGNRFLAKQRPDQYALYIAHGAPLKNTSGHYTLPKGIDESVTISEYMREYEAINLHCPMEKILPLGLPRNDVLRLEPMDVHRLFPNAEFNRLVYWMPTYRQHRKSELVHSTVAMPILYDEEIAEKVNSRARELGVMVVVKPHFVQDVSRIKALQLSHLRFIDQSFLEKNRVGNYELLRSADALLTDYSSVYYDYLLLNRPIGLCWDDFEEYKQREGFQVDMDTVMAGGEKIYNAEDLCGFLQRLANGEDSLRARRGEVRRMVLGETGGEATTRVVDHIEQILRGKEQR